MLKHIIIGVVFYATLAASTMAQQVSTPDPVVVTYANLLAEANSRIAALSAQLQQSNQVKSTLETRIDELTKELDAAKKVAIDASKPAVSK